MPPIWTMSSIFLTIRDKFKITDSSKIADWDSPPPGQHSHSDLWESTDVTNIRWQDSDYTTFIWRFVTASGHRASCGECVNGYTGTTDVVHENPPRSPRRPVKKPQAIKPRRRRAEKVAETSPRRMGANPSSVCSADPDTGTSRLKTSSRQVSSL